MTKPEFISAKPEALGLSSARLARLDRFLKERYVDAGKIPCAQTLVFRRGQIAHQNVMGLADVERGRALKDDAIFRIYSMTKPITSIAFMTLVEDGAVSLDEPVHRLIPEWREMGVYVSGEAGAFQTKRTEAPMRMIDLLRHTSGLTYDFQWRTKIDAAYRAGKIGQFNTAGGLDRMIGDLAKLPLEFSPGQRWNYSVSTDVLGYLVSKISGEPFDRFLKRRIFEPLGMVDTDFHVPPEKAHRLPSCYTRTPAGKVLLQDDCETSYYRQPPALQSGGGGLVSTAADYARFCQMLINGGRVGSAQIVSPKTIQLMTMNHLPGGKELTEMSVSLFSEAVFNGLGFGLGFAMTLDVARTQNLGTAGEYFWGGMASTAFWVDPVEELFVVFMTQLTPSNSYPIRRDLRALVYGAMTESNVG